MRLLRRGAVASALLVVLVGTGLAMAPPAASAPDRASRKTATEVCEEMVKEAVEAVAQQPLASPQQGAWLGQTYTCTYNVGDGSLVLRVDVLGSRTGARAAYRQVRLASTVDQTFRGIGQAAFQAKDGTLVARKDRFLLTADPSALPARLSKQDLTFAAVSAVLTCWTGET